MTALSGNPAALVALRAAQSGTWIMPVVVVFWQRAGLGLAEVFQLQAAFAAAMFALEVPTGALADRWGRKSCLALCFALWSAAMAAYPLASSFNAFLALELLVALAASLGSGADTALLYDTLRLEGRRDDFTLWQGRVVSAGYWAETAAAFAGGLLAAWSLSLPFWAFAAQLGAAAALCLTLREAPTELPAGTREEADYGGLARVPGLAAALALYAVLSVSTYVAAWLYQPVWQSLSFPLSWFGALWAACLAAAALAARGATGLSARFGPGRVLAAACLLPGTGLLALAAGPAALAVPACLLIQSARGLYATVLVDAVHRRVPSRRRATAHSVMLAGGRLAFIVVGPAVGWAADAAGLPAALAGAGAALLAAAWLIRRALPADFAAPTPGPRAARLEAVPC